MVYIFVQMSCEMWDFDIYGEDPSATSVEPRLAWQLIYPSRRHPHSPLMEKGGRWQKKDFPFFVNLNNYEELEHLLA